MLVSVWYWVTQQFFCAVTRSDVDWSVMVLFDPESECCFCPRGGRGWGHVSLSLLCLLRTTQPCSLGPWDPKSLDIRGLWDATCSYPTPALHRDCFSPIMCFQLTDWCNNYEHLEQQICENMWKGNRHTKVSLNYDLVSVCESEQWGVLYSIWFVLNIYRLWDISNNVLINVCNFWNWSSWNNIFLIKLVAAKHMHTQRTPLKEWNKDKVMFNEAFECTLHTSFYDSLFQSSVCF